MMESVTLNSRCQITLPISVLDDLGLEKGSQIELIKKEGYYILKNNTDDVFSFIQSQFKEDVNKIGWKTPEDILHYLKEKRRNKANANNG